MTVSLVLAGYYYIPIAFAGAVVGTVYGALLRRPENNRSIRSFLVASAFTLVTYLVLEWQSPDKVLAVNRGWQPTLLTEIVGFAMVVLFPAVACAQVTEFIRKIIEKTIARRRPRTPNAEID
ncbi:hypothetical protein [Adhaeretor mobilis]|uniref:hypothetical protein n=1 Tax=Adhaeretor mobilis TaxID=1930276 RepID=UPI0011A0DC38|nr:hypothetical protein [Adhaeretor mobilis]